MWIIHYFSYLVTESARQNGLLCGRVYEYMPYTSRRFTVIGFRRCKFYCGFMKNTFGSVATNVRKMYWHRQTVSVERTLKRKETTLGRLFFFSSNHEILTFFGIELKPISIECQFLIYRIKISNTLDQEFIKHF